MYDLNWTDHMPRGAGSCPGEHEDQLQDSSWATLLPRISGQIPEVRGHLSSEAKRRDIWSSKTAYMTDSTLWVAVLTGGTAVLASWVTSRGTARAARVQAEASADAQQREKVRELRRSAYADLMEQAHITGELYYRVGDAYVQNPDATGHLVGIESIRNSLRDAFDPLMRSVRIITLEGPRTTAEAAEALKNAASTANSVLWTLSRGESEAQETFDEAHERFRVKLDEFIASARAAMNDM